MAPGTVLQKAYGILDKYKLSRSFFVKTDQNSCEIAEAQAPQQHHQQQQAQTNEALPPSGPAGVQNDNGTKKPGKKGTQKKGAQTTGRDEGAVVEGESAVKVEKEKEKEVVVPVHKEHEPNVAADHKSEVNPSAIV